MSSIDDLKDKITDGEYLNLCNLLKSLNEEIKEKKEERNRPSGNSNIEGEIVEFLNNNSHDENGNELNTGAIFLRFNEFLEELEQRYIDEDGNYIEEQEYFLCVCGCSVRTSAISEHIEDENHALRFLE
jgi:hypothetical protein